MLAKHSPVSYETDRTRSFRSVPYTLHAVPAKVRSAVNPVSEVWTLEAL